MDGRVFKQYIWPRMRLTSMKCIAHLGSKLGGSGRPIQLDDKLLALVDQVNYVNGTLGTL